MSHVILTHEPLSLDALHAAVAHPGAGAIVTFSGLVRDENEGHAVEVLEYSAYEPMAVAEMKRIVEALEREFTGVRVAVGHRLGELRVGDLAVVCVASSKHRPAAFAATRACIDRIKENVPIWKREHGPHGATWVGWVDARCTPDGHGHGQAPEHASPSHEGHERGSHAHVHAHTHAHRSEQGAAYPPDPSRHARPDTEAARKAIRVVTVTVSDTRTEDDDTSGIALREELSAFQCVRHVILRDDADVVGAFVREIARGDLADAVVLTGGTGIAPRDATYEAVSSLFDKTLDGFGETFRRLSFPEVGPRAMLSRATAGTVGRSLVFALPGSTNAARLGARELVAPLLVHAVGLLRGETPSKGTSSP